MVTLSFSSVFYLLTFLSLRSLLTVSNSLILSVPVVLHSPPTLSRSLLKQSSMAFSVFLAAFSPRLSCHLTSFPMFHLPFFPHDRSISTSSLQSGSKYKWINAFQPWCRVQGCGDITVYPQVPNPRLDRINTRHMI